MTASKDGSLRIWDGVSAECVRPIIGAHGSVEATSAIFTKDERSASASMCKMLLGNKEMCVKCLCQVNNIMFIPAKTTT